MVRADTEIIQTTGHRQIKKKKSINSNSIKQRLS